MGIPLKADSIDGAVSISAVQWLCHLPNPKLALARLFRGLYRSLKLGCKAVMQVYLAGNSQVDLLLSSATAEGFSGGLYVGFPHRGLARKYFLCLSKGSSPTMEGQVWSQACPLALPVQCGCTWQWLQRTVPAGQGDPMASGTSLTQDPSRGHASNVQSQHIKHTRRLLRLFRHALSKQASTPLQGSSPAHGLRSYHAHETMSMPSVPGSEHPETLLLAQGASSALAVGSCAAPAPCPASAAAALDSASAQASSALSGAASAAARDSTADPGLSACTAATSAVAVTTDDSSSAPHSDTGQASRLQSAHSNKADLARVGSQANPSAGATLLVEAIVPDEKLCTNSCHMRCVFNISVAIQALSSYCCRNVAQMGTSVTALEGTQAQRHFIETLVRQHMQSKDFGLNVDAHVQLSSSIKGPPASPVVPLTGISHKAKKVRTGKEDETELTAFPNLRESQQTLRLPQALVLSRLMDDDKDCSLQVLRIGPFTKYLVLSQQLPALAGCCMKDGNLLTSVIESTMTTVHKLSAGNVSILAVDVHILQDRQSLHIVCYCGDLNT
ncbi:hypothetical protein ABBQ38_005745 [Trebouxia sp. C0009 RCD-2024]